MRPEHYIQDATIYRSFSSCYSIFQLRHIILIPQYKAPIIAETGMENGISWSIFHCFI